MATSYLAENALEKGLGTGDLPGQILNVLEGERATTWHKFNAESIEHGEGSVDSALNLVIQAYVARLILHVSMPFQKDTWTEQLSATEPRLKQGLENCYKLLSQTTTGAAPQTDRAFQGAGMWAYVIPIRYGLTAWDDLSDHYFNVPFDLEMVTSYLAENALEKGLGIGDLPGQILNVLESERATTWHKFLFANIIARLVAKREGLTLENWLAAVDLCAGFVASSKPVGQYEIEYDNTEPHVPPTSTEFWAWQFGRVAALASSLMLGRQS